MAVVQLKNAGYSVAINTLGAEMISFKGADGKERIWSGDPAWWANHAPLLFPIAGGLKDDKYTLDGVTYPMDKHGFAKTREFQVEEQAENSATFLLNGEAGWHEGFPFRYSLRVKYLLEGASLRVDYIVDNEDEREFCFAIGGHEAYACPEGVEAYDIIFDEVETLDTHPVTPGGVSVEGVPVMENTRVLPLKDEYFTVDALIFLDAKSRGVQLVKRGETSGIRVDFEGFDYLLFWHKYGAPYLCIEPWTCAPKMENATYDIREKMGIITLAPGARDMRTHVITI